MWPAPADPSATEHSPGLKEKDCMAGMRPFTSEAPIITYLCTFFKSASAIFAGDKQKVCLHDPTQSAFEHVHALLQQQSSSVTPF